MAFHMDPVSFFKALADSTRLRILLLCHYEKELCVCELTEALQLSQPKISRHLAQLRQTGLLQDRRDGQWVFYRLHEQLPAWAQEVFAETAASQRAFVEQNINNLRQMGNRPERRRQCC